MSNESRPLTGAANATKRGVLANVQLARAYAALIVVIGHTLHDLEAFGPGAGDLNAQSINWGAGVDIFFVISGFIMVLVAGDDFGKPGASWRFFSRRVARVAPLYWLATTAVVLGALAMPSWLNVPLGDWRHVLASYAFIPDLRPGLTIARPVLALGWTLNFEMLFYVVFALAMFLPFRFGVAAVAGLFVLAACFHVAFAPSDPRIAFWTDPVALEFVFGVLIGVAFRRGVRLAALPALAMVLLGLALATVDVTAMANGPALTPVVRFGLPAALAISGAALGPQLTKGRALAWGVALGDASYALYLSHPFVIRPLRKMDQMLLGGGDGVLFAVIAAALCVGLALALHRWLEKPLTRSLVSRLRDAPAAIAPADKPAIEHLRAA